MLSKSFDGQDKKVKRGMKKNGHFHISFWVFVIPCAALFVMFFAVPLVLNIFYSFTDYDGFRQMNIIGFENYKEIFQDKDFYQALIRTFIYTLVSLPFKVFIPLLLANLLVSKLVKMKTLTRGLIYLPVLLSSLVVGLTINWMFGEQYGLINYIMEQLHFTRIPWATSPFFAKMLIIIASTWASTGFYMLIYIGALNGIDEEVYEAALLDGATPWQKFFNVTVPLIKPTTFLVSLLSVISLLKEYGLVQGITQGGPGTSTTYIVQYILNQGFDQSKYGYASTASVLVMFIFAIIAFVQFKVSNGGEIDA